MVKNLAIEDGVDYESLGLEVQEPDRMQLDTRGAMSITRIRFDYKTRFWNDKTKEGTPITKFDGIDTATGARVKYFTLSSIIQKKMVDIISAVGAVMQKDENGNEWAILKKPIKVKGFEKVSTGENTYLKIKTN